MKTFFRDMAFLFSRRDLLRFLLLVCLLVAGTGIELISLAAVPIFVGILTQSGGETVLMLQLQNFFQHFGWEDYALQLRLSSLFFLALFAFRTLYLYGSYSLQERILNNRCVELGSRIFSAYMSASYRFLLQRNSQDLVKSVVVDSDRVVNRVLGPLINLLRSLVVMFGVVTMLLIYTPLITVFALFCLLLFAGGYLYWNRQNTRRHGEADAENRKAAMAAVAEGIGGFKEIQVGGCKDFFVTRLHRALEKICSSQRWLAVSQLIMWPYLELVTISVLVVSTLLALGFAQQNFSAIAPVMALFAVALFRLKGYVTDAMLNYTILRYNLVSVNLVCQDLRTLQQEKAEQHPRRPGGQTALPFQEHIHIEKVDFHYDNMVEATLQGIDLMIPQGSSVAFVGATGSGKSTLLDILLGLLEPNSGRILLDGRDIQENLLSWQAQIGYVPQQIFLLDDSIRANIAFGVPDNEIDEESLKQAINAAQLEEFVRSLPDGDKTGLGERGIRISGGQRQRIGVARALYQNPSVLFFDEATSALDTLTEEALTNAIEALRGDHTVIVVAHRLTTVQKADCLFFLDGGRLVASGTFDELCAANPAFKAMTMGMLKQTGER